MRTTSVTVMLVILKVPFWRLFNQSSVQSSLSTVARHIDNSIVEDTLQLKTYQFHKDFSLYFKEHWTKLDEISTFKYDYLLS